MTRACDDCLRRTDLVAALAAWLDIEWRRKDAPGWVLARADEALLAACGSPDVRARYDHFDATAAREAVRAAGLAAVCRCEDEYPARLRDLPDPPAVLHMAGDPGCVGVDDSVAVVGARRATPYGLTVARDLGRGRSTAGRRGSRGSPAAPTGPIRPPSASCTPPSARPAQWCRRCRPASASTAGRSSRATA
jgi:DNA processing protein